MSPWCRKCGGTDGLKQRGSVLYCVGCFPAKRCLDCRRMASETGPWSTYRRCAECVLARVKAGRRLPARNLTPEERANRNPRHIIWLRHQRCLIGDCHCSGRMHAHHVRSGSQTGYAQLPDDRLAVPLCAHHHLAEGHQKGWQTFEARYKVNLRAEAFGYAERSPFVEISLDDPRINRLQPTAHESGVVSGA